MMELLRALLLFALVLEAAGIAVSSMLLLDARRDLEAVELKQIGNGRRMVARSALFTEAFRLGSLVLLTASSAASTVTLWDLEPDRITGPLYAAMWFFEAATMLIVAQSITVYLTRRRLFDGYRQRLVRQQSDEDF